jgi:hypothetical protein
MARKPSSRSRIELLTEKWEPAIKTAFFAAVTDIVNKAELNRIVERLERGDIAGAIDAVHLDPVAFRALDGAIVQAFDAGGSSQIGALPRLTDPQGNRFVIRWDARNVRAEAWLRHHSSTLITRINEEQRAVVRSVLEKAMIEGRNPRATALDIIGRVNRATGRRSGGVVGLSGPQVATIDKTMQAMLSGDVEGLRAYLKAARRDKRFDATVRKAIEQGAALPRDMASRITGRYADGLLAFRGEVIARTETMAALNQSGIEAMQQAVDAGAVDADTVTKIWHTARDKRVRDSHAAIDRESVGMNALFSNGLAFPGDPSGGAHEVANCRCWMETRIDFTAGLIEEERRLAGLQ